jgi:hypothetical protein
MLTSSFLMLGATSFIICINCSHVPGFPFKYTLDFMQPHMKSTGDTVGQVTERAMAQVRLFLTIDQQNVH